MKMVIMRSVIIRGENNLKDPSRMHLFTDLIERLSRVSGEVCRVMLPITDKVILLTGISEE